MNARNLLGLLFVASVAAIGCGDDASPDPGTPPADADAAAADAGLPDGSVGMPELTRFAALIRLRQPDGTINATYLETLETLDPNTTITTANAREFTAGLRLKRYLNFAFLEDFSQPVITRLEYDPATGTFTDGPTLTFQPRGVINVLSYFLSPTKAYVVDSLGLRVAAFNPTEMVLRPETIDLTNLRPDGLNPNGVDVEVRGNRTFIGVAFADLTNPAAPQIERAITVAVIDNDDDELLTVLRDERCGHVAGSMQSDNGDIYFLGDNGFNVIDTTRTACIVRIPAGSETFDDYLWQPAADLGGREASGLVGLRDTSGVVFALYPEELDPTNPTSIALDPVRRPWVIDVAAQTASVAAGAPFTRTGIPYDIGDDRLFGLLQDFTATEAYAFDPVTGAATLRARSEGQLFALTVFP